MIMPFGKYEGWDFEDIPNHYLDWMCNNFDEERQELIDAADEELTRRGDLKIYIGE